MSKLPRADWYPDPEYAGQLRYWDGRQWTEHRAPMQQSAPHSAAQASVQLQAAHRVAQPGPAAGQEQSAPQAAEPSVAKSAAKIPLFGARKHAQETSGELERLRGEMQRLGVLDVAELRREREELQAQIAKQRAAFEQERFALDAQLTNLRHTVVLTQEAEILQEV